MVASLATHAERVTAVVALIGNPNSGKTTVFNRLTGLRERIGNYPGVTVEKKSGKLPGEGRDVEVVDLPGMYSLAAHSPDERIVVDVLSGHIAEPPGLVVCVLNACQLKRNLFLASQIAELDIPLVLVVNQMDAAARQGIEIDIERLEQNTGVPVVATSAASGEGMLRLRQVIRETLDAPPRCMRRIEWPEAVHQARAELRDGIQEPLSDPELSRMLFDTDSAVAERVFGDRRLNRGLIERARQHLVAAGLNPGSAEAVLHYRHLDLLLEGVERHKGEAGPRKTDSIDRFLLHRFWGGLAFVAIMWLVFQSIYAWAGPLMDGIEWLTGLAQSAVSPRLEGMPMLQSLVVDGAIAGVGGVVVFLPQIAILFFFVGLLEDSGYMARAAFLMDKLFGWCGLNGKSFVPMLSSYACAVPGILATRTLADPKARLITILMAPLMSCSARLPVYVLLIGAFVEPVYGAAAAGWVLFAMHFVGLAVALPLAWLLSRLLSLRSLPFVLEMPPYRTPRWHNLILRVWKGGREFLVRAGTVILAFSIIIWALLYFPRDPTVAEVVRGEFTGEIASQSGLTEAQIEDALEDPASELSLRLDNRIEGIYVEQSYLGRFGNAVQPVFAPAGFDWKITVGVLSSFPAREVIIATLGIVYHLGADVDESSPGLTSIMTQEQWKTGPRSGQPVYTLPVVFAIMVFFALCMQCGATVAVIKQELNAAWATGAFVGMTALAWLAAVAVYQIGSAL